MKLIVKNTLLTNSDNKTYIGCHIKQTSIIRYLRVLRRMLGDDIYVFYRKNKYKRDQGLFHITAINADEYQLLKLKNIDFNLNQNFEVRLYGIGRTRNAESVTYYIIVQSEQLHKYRKLFRLKPHDFHITLGYNPDDIHNVSKGNETLIKTVGNLPL